MSLVLDELIVLDKIKENCEFLESCPYKYIDLKPLNLHDWQRESLCFACKKLQNLVK